MEMVPLLLRYEINEFLEKVQQMKDKRTELK